LSSRINFDDIEVQKLRRDTDLTNFDCSLDDDLGLDVFIHKEALAYQETLLGITYLFYYKSNFVGFVTLAMGRLRGKYIEKEEIRLSYYPALLIGRLAVDNNYRKRGICRFICDWCTGFAERLAKNIGCKFLVLDTNKRISVIYEKCGFLGARENDRIIMFKKIEINSF